MAGEPQIFDVAFSKYNWFDWFGCPYPYNYLDTPRFGCPQPNFKSAGLFVRMFQPEDRLTYLFQHTLDVSAVKIWLVFENSTLNPQPSTLNSQLSTLNPFHWTRQLMKFNFTLSVFTLFLTIPLGASENDPPNAPQTAVPKVAEQKNKTVAKFQYKSDGIEVPAATADEPKVKSFGQESILAAKQYLDDGANYWVRERKCVACHSTGVYMVERPALTALLGKPSDEVLTYFVESIPAKIGPPEIRDGVKYWGVSIQSVWRSSGLAAWDKHVTGTLSEHTDKSLRHTLQCLADEGFIKTIDQVEIPYITTDFELTVQAARAIANAPGWLAALSDTDTLDRIARLKKYLTQHSPISDYEHAVKLQLAGLMPNLVSQEQHEASIAMLWRQQLPDGGWSTRRCPIS